ncbi:MAG TPA: TonB C-terminal domain-containing protein [Candidatus Obscuribacterales bacterium]
MSKRLQVRSADSSAPRRLSPAAPWEGKEAPRIGDFNLTIDTRGATASTDSWTDTVLERLSENWHPAEFTGRLGLLLVLDREGNVLSAKPIMSSGNAQADAVAIEAIKRTVLPIPPHLESTVQKRQQPPQITAELLLTGDSAKRCRDFYATHSLIRSRIGGAEKE